MDLECGVRYLAPLVRSDVLDEIGTGQRTQGMGYIWVP